jgi:tetratricopeptide (TPR) repeat protein
MHRPGVIAFRLKGIRTLRSGLVLLAVLGVSLAELAWAAKPEAVNLLRLPAAKLEQTTATGNEVGGLSALTDDNPGTFTTAAATERAPLELVYGFGGATVTPSRLVIRLPEKAAAEAATGRVELLVSTLSAHAGFRSVRTDPLKPTAKPQEFAFPPTAARWLMLRFTPAAESTSVAIAEAAVLGREGPPVTNYAFTESPAKAFDVLARLRKISALNLTISADEAALFADAQDGRLDHWSFAEAALFASGIQDAAKRKAYLARLDALEQEARKVVADARTPHAKGEKLLQWLHQRPMAKGYVAGQTDLSAILDTGTFNCVSSAALYNVLGRRLGLDLRAIEVPDHAFSILYMGKEHADVETTTPHGFNPARDRAAQEEFKQRTGFTYIPDSHRDQRREIGETGLVAIIYYNHGVELTREKRYHEALLAYFRAMSLDPEFASAVKNALAVLANWSGELARGGKFEEALNVLGTGLDLAPRDATLLHNRKVVWHEWAEAAMKAGKEDEALAIARRAAEAVPDGDFLALQAWLYIRGGEERIKAGNWEKAIALVEPALEKLDAGPRAELRKWRAGVRLRWANAELDRGNFEKTVALLQESMTLEPEDPRFANNLGYTVQQWVRKTYAREGEARARAVLVAQLERFPQVPEVQRTAKGFIHGLIRDLRRAGKHEEALAAIDRLQDLLKDDGEARDIVRGIYDRWADQCRDAKDWQGAVDVYAKALARWPEDKHLRNNLGVLVRQWARATYTQDGEDKARAVLAAQLQRFPKVPDVAEAAQAYVHQVARDLKEAGKFAEAQALIDRHKELLKDEGQAKDLSVAAYDDQARKLSKAGQWNEAVTVYEKALQRFPNDSHLRNNLAYTAQEWVRHVYEKGGGEEKARTVVLDLLQRFPNDKDVQDVAKGHVQRVVRKFRDAGKFEEALAVVDRHKDVLKDADEAKDLAVGVYDAWARTFFKDKRWAEAIAIYDKGLLRFPDASLLTNNRKYCQAQLKK